MTFRQRLGLGVPPILLRLAIAATFIWAGSGKFFGPITLSPEQEATLRAIHSGAAPAPAPTPAPPASSADAPAGKPTAAAPAASRLLLIQNAQPAEPEPTPDASSDQSATDQPAKPDANAPAPTKAEGAEAPASASTAPGPKRRAVDGITLLIHAQATPNEKGEALLPAFMGKGKWPMWIANTEGVVELLGGILIFLGLFTRLWSLALAGVMVGALWMTSIGPVVIYGAPGWPAFMPVLPALDGFRVSAWQTWLWQLGVLCGALSLFCLGAGGLSLDRFFFGKPGAPKHEPIDLDLDED